MLQFQKIRRRILLKTNKIVIFLQIIPKIMRIKLITMMKLFQSFWDPIKRLAHIKYLQFKL